MTTCNWTLALKTGNCLLEVVISSWRFLPITDNLHLQATIVTDNINNWELQFNTDKPSYATGNASQRWQLLVRLGNCYMYQAIVTCKFISRIYHFQLTKTTYNYQLPFISRNWYLKLAIATYDWQMLLSTGNGVPLL